MKAKRTADQWTHGDALLAVVVVAMVVIGIVCAAMATRTARMETLNTIGEPP